MNKNRIIPCLAYEDAKTAIDWLCNVFGFEKIMVVDGEDNTVAHCQLAYDGNMIMLGSSQRDGDWNKRIKLPKEVGGFVTQSSHIVIDENLIDAHYQNSIKQGAKIIVELEEQPYGGKFYSCSDPEGNLWSFGSYDPWLQQ